MPETAQSTNQKLLLLLSLLVFAVGTYFYMQPHIQSLDLMALWLGGHFYHAGEFAQIYAPDMGVFTMYPPNAWVEYLRAEHGFTGAVYPYIYPPIWAWLAAPVASNVAFSVVSKIALMFNIAALAGAMGLTYRLTKTQMHPVLYVALAAAVLLFTPIGYLALMQAQVQIVISFLILLALERARFNHPVAAGIALALAAALKLYPALFALFWLATGERRAAASFALFGGALGVLSILLTGWPLHVEFLHQIATISNTVFVTAITINFDAIIALFFQTDALHLAPVLDEARLDRPIPGYLILARPLTWKVLSNLALVAVLAALWWGFRRADADRRYDLMWPVALTLIPLLAPIAWIYYYIPSVLFAATLPGRGSMVKGLLMVALMIPIYQPILQLKWQLPVATVLVLLIWCVAFAFAPRDKIRK